MTHAFIPRAWEAETVRSLSLRPDWSTKLRRETLRRKTRKKIHNKLISLLQQGKNQTTEEFKNAIWVGECRILFCFPPLYPTHSPYDPGRTKDGLTSDSGTNSS